MAILDGETFEQIGRIDSEFFHRAPEVIDLGGGTQTNTSSLPHGVALNNDGSKLYVGVEWAEVPGLVVVDVASREVTGKIDLLLEGGHFFAVDPLTGKLSAPHLTDDRVVVQDTRTEDIVKIIPVQGGPVGVDFRDGEAWIHSDGDGSVTVIDTYSDEVVAVIQTEGRGAGRMAVSPDGRSGRDEQVLRLREALDLQCGWRFGAASCEEQRDTECDRQRQSETEHDPEREGGHARVSASPVSHAAPGRCPSGFP